MIYFAVGPCMAESWSLALGPCLLFLGSWSLVPGSWLPVYFVLCACVLHGQSLLVLGSWHGAYKYGSSRFHGSCMVGSRIPHGSGITMDARMDAIGYHLPTANRSIGQQG